MSYRPVIDPGHGERGHGAQAEGLSEHALNRDMAERVQRLCAASGVEATIIEGAPGDGWAELDALARAAHADLVVSVHHNAGGPECRGAEAYYAPGNRLTQRICEEVLYHMPERLRTYHSKARAASPDNGYARAACVVNGFTEPVALIECYYLTSPHDREFAATPWGRDQIAAAIHWGILIGAERQGAQHP